jgi:hypothetical protein
MPSGFRTKKGSYPDPEHIDILLYILGKLIGTESGREEEFKEFDKNLNMTL